MYTNLCIKKIMYKNICIYFLEYMCIYKKICIHIHIYGNIYTIYKAFATRTNDLGINVDVKPVEAGTHILTRITHGLH